MVDRHTSDRDTVALVERLIARGTLQAAREALLPSLDQRGDDGDPVCRLAALLMRAAAQSGHPATDDALATALDRLLAVAKRQDGQLVALQRMVEDTL